MPNIPLELALVIRLRAKKKSGHGPTSRKSLFPVWKLFKYQRQVLFIDLMLKQLLKQYFHPLFSQKKGEVPRPPRRLTATVWAGTGVARQVMTEGLNSQSKILPTKKRMDLNRNSPPFFVLQWVHHGFNSQARISCINKWRGSSKLQVDVWCFFNCWWSS